MIPIGAGNEVTMVFQDGFQLKTVEEMALEQSQSTAEEGNPESPVNGLTPLPAVPGGRQSGTSGAGRLPAGRDSGA